MSGFINKLRATHTGAALTICIVLSVLEIQPGAFHDEVLRSYAEKRLCSGVDGDIAAAVVHTESALAVSRADRH